MWRVNLMWTNVSSFWLIKIKWFSFHPISQQIPTHLPYRMTKTNLGGWSLTYTSSKTFFKSLILQHESAIYPFLYTSAHMPLLAVVTAIDMGREGGYAIASTETVQSFFLLWHPVTDDCRVIRNEKHDLPMIEYIFLFYHLGTIIICYFNQCFIWITDFNLSNKYIIYFMPLYKPSTCISHTHISISKSLRWSKEVVEYPCVVYKLFIINSIVFQPKSLYKILYSVNKENIPSASENFYLSVLH